MENIQILLQHKILKFLILHKLIFTQIMMTAFIYFLINLDVLLEMYHVQLNLMVMLFHVDCLVMKKILFVITLKIIRWNIYGKIVIF